VLQLMDFGQLKDPLPLTIAIADTVTSLGPDLSQFAVELDDPGMVVLELFPDAPLKRHLHVIVRVPFPGELGGSLHTNICLTINSLAH
jgi:hypothetical protein